VRRTVAAAVLLAVAAPLGAQTVGGIVRDRVTSGVVENATIELRAASDSSVASARSDSLGMFYLTAPAPGTYTLRFRLGVGPQGTTPPIVLATADTFHQSEYVVDVPDERIFFEFQVQEPVEPLNAISPAYPREMQERRTSGRVVAQYVVDTSGRADVTTLKGLEFTDHAFLEAVRQALPRMRFKPAEIRGRRVRQLVHQTFAFEIRPGIPSRHPRADSWPPPMPRTRPPR
jgi:TonB family protein